MKRKNIGPQPFTHLLEEINESWVEEDRVLGVPTSSDLSVTGQPYVTISTETPDPDKDQAFVAGLGAFKSYARNRSGNLYWRETPMIERIRHDEGGYGYRVSMKLLISDNPIVPRLAADALREIPECT